MTGRTTMTYKCRMCPSTAFKWQSCLYKHLLISHFSEKIKGMMPKNPPLICPMENCEYEAKLKHILMIHVGITHKLLLKWVDEEAEANDGKSMIVLSKSTEELPHVTVSKNAPKKCIILRKLHWPFRLKSTFFEKELQSRNFFSFQNTLFF